MASDAWNSYFYPGTNTFINHDGIRDRQLLARAEALLSGIEANRIHREPSLIDQSGPPAAVLRRIHFELFKDLYEWAGQHRYVNMRKEAPDGTISGFADRARMEAMANDAAAYVDLPGWDRNAPAEVSDRLARVYQRINEAHLFREGNGRTGKVYLDLVARKAGYTLNYDAMTKDEWIAASVQGRLQTQGPQEAWPEPTMMAQLINTKLLTRSLGPDIAFDAEQQRIESLYRATFGHQPGRGSTERPPAPAEPNQRHRTQAPQSPGYGR